jgi:hypothetical protein
MHLYDLIMRKQLSPELEVYVNSLSDTRNFFRAWAVFAILEIGELILGIAFFIIIHGVIFGIAWLGL